MCGSSGLHFCPEEDGEGGEDLGEDQDSLAMEERRRWKKEGAAGQVCL